MQPKLGSVAISGDPGSGKSAISTALAQRLGLSRVGAGDLHRSIAKELGLSTLQLNLYEEDNAVDRRVVSMLEDIAESGERVVVDARLAWNILRGSLKVHLIVDPEVAARRIFQSRLDSVERYSTFAETIEGLAERSRRERQRFKALYKVDLSRLRNYDLVIDTSIATVDETLDCICDAMVRRSFCGESTVSALPELFLAPPRVHPTCQDEVSGRPIAFEAFTDIAEPIKVGYCDPTFFVLDGHRRLLAAIRDTHPYIRAVLLAENGESLTDDLSAEEYFKRLDHDSLKNAWDSSLQCLALNRYRWLTRFFHPIQVVRTATTTRPISAQTTGAESPLSRA